MHIVGLSETLAADLLEPSFPRKFESHPSDKAVTGNLSHCNFLKAGDKNGCFASPKHQTLRHVWCFKFQAWKHSTGHEMHFSLTTSLSSLSRCACWHSCCLQCHPFLTISFTLQRVTITVAQPSHRQSIQLLCILPLIRFLSSLVAEVAAVQL